MLRLLKKEVSNVTLYAPMSGTIIELENVPDPVFAGKMIGDGVAIHPVDGEVVAPCDGKIVQVFPTKHAVGIHTKEGIDVLIHLGIDTVTLRGAGFKALVSEGNYVTIGDKLIEADLDYINKNAKSTITPVIITNMHKVKNLSFGRGKVVNAKDILMTLKV